MFRATPDVPATPAGQPICVEHLSSEPPVNDDILFHQRAHRVQTFGWLLILLFLALAAVGIFGSHPLSSRAHGNNFWVEYERVLHFQKPTELHFKLQALQSDPRNGFVSIGIDAGYLEQLSLERIIPEPANSTISSNGTVFTFGIEPGTEIAQIIFRLTPTKPGTVGGTFRFQEETISLKQTVMP